MGASSTRSHRVDAAVLAALEKYIPLAPLHQPHNLSPIRGLLERLPQLPQVACFDTAFHRRQPAVAQAFALPKSITERGVRRYGFHGLSYEYIAQALPDVDPRVAAGKTIVLHLGNGASMCAMAQGEASRARWVSPWPTGLMHALWQPRPGVVST
jgi:acetate kinase